MPHRTSEESQRIAARVAGFSLLLVIASGVCGSFVFQNHLVVSDDAAATARNLLTHGLAFRAGIACGIVMFNCDVVLALALYALLEPVNSTLALLGAFWRVANAVVLGAGVAASFVALDILGGAHYLTVFKTDQLQALTMLFLHLHGSVSLIGLIFFSLGAAVHSYVLLKSGYIPRILSGAYLFVAIQLLLCAFALVIFPSLSHAFGLGFVAPDFVVELSVALWLAFKGARIPPRDPFATSF